MKFNHVYMMDPIDFWEKATLADEYTTAAVLAQMPEPPRNETVYKLILPDPPEFSEVYLCKADNNGTIYIFSNFDLHSVFRYITEV